MLVCNNLVDCDVILIYGVSVCCYYSEMSISAALCNEIHVCIGSTLIPVTGGGIFTKR